MNTYQTNQHRRILLLTGSLFFLAIIFLWQQGIASQLMSDGSKFMPSTSFYALCAAFIISMVGALTFIHNSSRELGETVKLQFIDSMTGMANQRKFDQRLKQELARAERHGKLVWIMRFDIDHLKDVNDSYGRDTGNQIIVEFGRRLQSILRVNDDAARINEDNFVAMLTEVKDTNTVEKVSDRLIELMAQPFLVGGEKIYCTVSIGTSVASNGLQDSAEAEKQANFALLQAKADGGNQMKIFETSMASRIIEKRTLETDLRNALQNNEIFVEYQPSVAQGTGKIVGCEALIRWRHRDRGVISPETFIPIAEETGIIHELGRFVLMQACSDFKELAPLKLAVNVSPVQFQQADFVSRLNQVLQETGFDPERLELEITEGLFISNPEKAIEFITAVRDLGVKIALDDFGTGYSSLSYLQEFSFDRIKIDRSFISKMEDSADAERLVSMMISMGDSLGFAVTVEGVETLSQLKKLNNFNYGEMQGFLFSEPVDIQQFHGLYDNCKANIQLGENALKNNMLRLVG